jgi:hypothetical protein
MNNIIDTSNMSYVTRKLISNIHNYSMKYDIDDANYTFERFNKLFEIINQIQEGDKLGFIIKDNNMKYFNSCNLNINKLDELKSNEKCLVLDIIENIYIDSYSSFQHLKRWYYNENRDKTNKILKVLFYEYEIFLTMVIAGIQNDTVEKDFKKLSVKCLFMNEKLLESLKILQNTYSTSKELVNTIQNIFFNIVQSNDKINLEL